MAYAQVEPFGDVLIDLHFASLQALLVNINQDPKKGKRYTPEDFMILKIQEPEEELTPSEIYQRFKANLGL